jgi:hypothetical protein
VVSAPARFEPRVVNGRVRIPLRLEVELYQALGATCGVLGLSMQEALAHAAAAWIAERCAQRPELSEAVRAILDAHAGPLAGEGEG